MRRLKVFVLLGPMLLLGCTETRVVSSANDKFAAMFGGNKNSTGPWQVERHDIEQPVRQRPVYDPNYKGNSSSFGTWKVTTSFDNPDTPQPASTQTPGAPWGANPFGPGR